MTKTSERVFLTKRDNAVRFAPPVHADEIAGRVLAVARDGRQMPLDTTAWRMVGWLTAANMLGWTRLYGWGRGLKRKL